jgi:tRNA (guanine37-N1)-methyltransferase
MPQLACLKVPKKLGEKAICLVADLDIFNRDYIIKKTEDFLCIPLNAEPSAAILGELKKKLSSFEISIQELVTRKTHFTHIDILADKLPSNLLDAVPRAIDFVGNIAIVEIPSELSRYKEDIGEAILHAHNPTKTVLAKSGAVEGIYRTREFELIAGMNKTSTVYKEYGNVYHVDVARAYFSPRLSSEHNRVAQSVKEGETVVDLFAGVGPFAVPIAKNLKNVLVYAVDINPSAVELLKKNILANRVEQQIIPVFGDARQVVKEYLAGKADHVIMNLPETALDFVDIACEALKPEGGLVHYYSFVKDSDPTIVAKDELTKAATKIGRQIEKFVLAKTVREVSPYTWQVVVDAKIQ